MLVALILYLWKSKEMLNKPVIFNQKVQFYVKQVNI